MATEEEFEDESYTYAQCKALLALIKTWKEEGFDCAIEQKRKEKRDERH